MPQDEKNLIPIDAPTTDFEHFLNDERNKRIFFSGKFGIGKTFFLEKFFEAQQEKTDVYHLFPVRYQIASNESIVELLKYDILVELLNKYPDAFKNTESKGLKGSFKLFAAFCKDRGLINRFLKSTVETGEGVLALSPDPLFQALGKLGRPLNELLAIDKEFQDFKKEYLSGDKGAVEKFLNEISAENDLVATDYISHLLYEKIEEVKGEKRSVLILDDFDRIDPEHIFRILNILSAHMEGEEENKFGFDHIIIVGDIDNLRSIFHHKYGEKTEFWGYFDKFFTVRPYIFNNDKAIAERIPHLLQRIKYEDEGLKDAIGESGIVKHLLEEVLGEALSLKAMNLRQLYKPINHSFPEVKRGVFYRDHFSDQRNQCIDIGIKLLIALYGNREHFLEILTKIRDNSSVTPHEGRQWFYAEYANSMLKRMIKTGVDSKHSWLDKYSIHATQDGNGSGMNFRLDGDAKAFPRFFYDTLLEYVKRSRYEKQSNYDYERF
ncbi:hypothetical protein CL654_00260 [bacterium]|nr:hypothetical protein [bacterium]|tara:strand:- start:28 stop:1506 length:1479 start_codon:yes stop_codon:yes gene_type:complete